MHTISLVLAFSAVCAGLGRRIRNLPTKPSVERTSEKLANLNPNVQTPEVINAEGKGDLAKVRAMCLRSGHLAAAFNPSVLVVRCPGRTEVASGSQGSFLHAPVMSPLLRMHCAKERTTASRMGIPRFFRWITMRFPEINAHLRQGRDPKEWIDNFYLDMNGIIHGCTHGDPELIGTAKTEEEFFERIFYYTDRLIQIANPRKLCYLAIDGVAPRAKMNQQRMRRYRAAREMVAAREKLREKSRGSGMFYGEWGNQTKEDTEIFNSNCITPGTRFLAELGERYKVWIAKKQASPDYKDGPVYIFSGSDVMGEGEHKIMDVIRRGQKSGDFTKETRHCMYGLDADLIMLSLVTHAPKFCLLRERQKFQKGKYAPKKVGSGLSRKGDDIDSKDFIFLEIERLRKMLGVSLRPSSALEFFYDNESFTDDEDDPTKRGDNLTAMMEIDKANARLFDEERLVDDFVFICMLVGNDFLPSLPHLSLSDGGIDDMLKVYAELLPSNGYLVDKRTINMAAFERFLSEISEGENHVFDERRMDYIKTQRMIGGLELPPYSNPLEYKREYYLDKFGLHPHDKEKRRSLFHSYLQGLSWCLAYYHDGCASWDWYYPDFYAPMASDLKELSTFDIKLELGNPFPPLAQLLSVLPPQSADLVPPSYGELMKSPTSPIIDAFPHNFTLDMNGHQNSWEGVALLPFIDQQRLLAAVEAIDSAGLLTKAERDRNILGQDIYFTYKLGDHMPAALPQSKRVYAVIGQKPTTELTKPETTESKTKKPTKARRKTKKATTAITKPVTTKSQTEKPTTDITEPVTTKSQTEAKKPKPKKSEASNAGEGTTEDGRKRGKRKQKKATEEGAKDKPTDSMVSDEGKGTATTRKKVTTTKAKKTQKLTV